MPDQQDNQDSENIERINEELTDSLQRCYRLVSQCRTKLVADPDVLLNRNDRQEPLISG